MTLALPLQSINKKKSYHWFVVSTVCIGAFMAALDASIINIALPSLESSFHVQMSQIEWVSLSYLLSLASMIIIFGRLSDLFGRRWFYAIGFLVFVLSSLGCGVAPTLSILITARIFQGVGAALLQANSVSIITAATPDKDRGKAIGIQASAQGIGLSLGPVLGGALLQLFNWRWIFFINLPVGLIGTLLGILLLPKDHHSSKRESFDYFGAFLLIPLLISIIYILNMGLKQGWGSPTLIAFYVVAILSFVTFIYLEKKVKDPLIDLKLFKIDSFRLGNLTGMLAFSVMYAVLLLTPYFLERVKALPPLTAGILTTLIPIGMTLATPFSGYLSDRLGGRTPMLSGLAFTSIGSALLIALGAPMPYVWLSVGLFFVGLGIGTFIPANNSNVMGHTPHNRLGVAGGILNMARTLGMGIGISIGGLIYQLFLTIYGSHDLVHSTKAYSSSFFIITLIAIITLFVVWQARSGTQAE